MTTLLLAWSSGKRSLLVATTLHSTQPSLPMAFVDTSFYISPTFGTNGNSLENLWTASIKWLPPKISLLSLNSSVLYSLLLTLLPAEKAKAADKLCYYILWLSNPRRPQSLLANWLDTLSLETIFQTTTYHITLMANDPCLPTISLETGFLSTATPPCLYPNNLYYRHQIWKRYSIVITLALWILINYILFYLLWTLDAT